MKVSEMMTKDVFTCTAEDSLAVAAHLMWDHDCGCIVIVDSGRRPVGVVTDRDACMAAYTQGLALRDIAVSSAASKLVHTVRFDQQLESAEQVMRAFQLHRLPVVDASGALVGIVSLNDLARAATRPTLAKTNGLTASGITQTLSANCERRPPTVVTSARG
jgi:CBS domain-containing protein